MLDVKQYLDNFEVGSKNTTLNAIIFFLEKYNNFEKNMKFIHIAGTNGKGSSTEIISNILIKQGYKVGKFLTPHLINYNERISINGKNISNQEMEEIIIELQPLIEEYNSNGKTNVSKFDLITITGLLYFYRNNVDFVVLETGLGGINDSTNVITKPIVSIISSIGYDHMKILGDTLEKIAEKKAGIIKKESNTVIFDEDDNENKNEYKKEYKKVIKVFKNKCTQKNNKLHVVKNSDILNYSYDNDFQYFDYKEFKNMKINLKGKMQVRNACLCLEVVRILIKSEYKIDINKIKKGLETIIHKGRMEKLNNNPTIIFDGTHNEPAVKNFLEMVEMYYKNKKRVYVISILNRKDYKKMLEIFAKDKEASFILTSGNNTKNLKRYAEKEELYRNIIKHTKSNKVIMKDLEDVIKDIMNKNNKDCENIYFFVGSLYTYGLVVSKINEMKIK